MGISPLSPVIDPRRERVLDAARFPSPVRDLFGHLVRRGNPWGFPQAERDGWLASRDGDLPILPLGEETRETLWLGCMGGYDPHAREAVVPWPACCARGG